MAQGEHSATLSTFIMVPFVIKDLCLSIFEWLLKIGFTVLDLSIGRLTGLFLIFESVTEYIRRLGIITTYCLANICWLVMYNS